MWLFFFKLPKKKCFFRLHWSHWYFHWALWLYVFFPHFLICSSHVSFLKCTGFYFSGYLKNATPKDWDVQFRRNKVYVDVYGQGIYPGSCSVQGITNKMKQDISEWGLWCCSCIVLFVYELHKTYIILALLLLVYKAIFKTVHLIVT